MPTTTVRVLTPHPRGVGGVLFLLCLSLAFRTLAPCQGQENPRTEPSQQFQTMSQEDIEAQLRALGMTMADAQQKAKEMGIDLKTFVQLQRKATKEQPVAKPQVSPAETLATAPPETLATKRKVRPPLPRGLGGLPYFGYETFGEVPAAFEPTAAGPVDPDYVIGPDDILRITVWGQVELRQELTVDKEGRIFIPTIGQILVSGLTLERATQTIKKEMARSYSGLMSNPPTAWLDVTVGRLRPKRVFVMGELKKPGGYTVSSYATVFNVLYSVGGPTVDGTLRDIRVLRNGQVIAHVDMYAYLAGENKTNDLRVQDNDIVYIPPRGKTVAIRGEVRAPAVYELLPGENLAKLIEFAGGILSTAYAERAQVDRITPFNERKPGVDERRVVDLDLRKVLNEGKDYDLYDQDLITVFPILDLRRNVVAVSGSVMRPGRFELDKVKTIGGLIAAAGGLDPKAYAGEAHLLRFNPDELTRRILQVPLGEILEARTPDIALAPRDSLLVFSTENTEVKTRFVTIDGQIKKPGIYHYLDGMTLRELILQAGGYTEGAERLEAEVSRVPVNGLSGDSLVIILHPDIPVSFDTVQATKAEEFLLQHRDQVFIRPNPKFVEVRRIAITGDYTYPGVYALKERGERLSSLLQRAGGPTLTSYLSGAQLFRNNKRVLVDFSLAMRGDQNHDIILQGGDSIHVPTKPRTVFVTGEVNRPGLLSFIEGDDVSDYIDRAGGKTDSSSYAILIKPTGESRKVSFGLFAGNPGVPEGSTIEVTRMKPEAEAKPVDIGGTIKDVFAILASAATVIYLIYQTTK
jgi:polysaccharide export outer membrane protein